MKISSVLWPALPLLVLQSAIAQPVSFQVLWPNHSSGVEAITPSQQAGYYGPPGVSQQAALWSGSAASYVNLNPPGATYSKIYAISDDQQVGSAQGHAGLWTGTAASFVDLNPAGASSSAARAIHGGQQAGVANFPTGSHAGYWSGTAASWVDLAPPGASGSGANCTTGTQQGGYYYSTGTGNRAAIWSGTAGSLVTLHPAGGSPYDGTLVYDMTPNYQVGVMDPYTGTRKAVMWFGTAASMINMNPSGAESSAIYAAAGDYQVGYAIFGGQFHAGLWNKSAASFKDLEPYVDSFFNQGAEADSIYVDNGTIYIGGKGYRDSYEYAVTWTIAPVPEPRASFLLGLALLVGCAAKLRPLRA